MSVGTQRLRDDADRLRAGAIAKREDPAVVDAALAADTSRRELSVKVDALRAERKSISADVGALLAAGTPKDDPKVVTGKAASQKIADQLTQLEEQLATAEAALNAAAAALGWHDAPPVLQSRCALLLRLGDLERE